MAYQAGYYGRDIGLADVLLTDTDRPFRKFLIEGAPGQGKSTASQYVCQVHRARILEKSDKLSQLPSKHRHAPERLPFRIELRRYASWLTDVNREKTSTDGVLVYLCQTIANISELSFSPDLLVAILAGSPSLIILDGLDEVADLDVRDKVVRSIEQLSSNLDAWKADAQLVVTSRPSTLREAATISTDEYIHLILADLSGASIDQYAATWVRIRKLPADEARDFRQAVTSALKAPHVADLARNPMQLAILLYLVYARGWGLPEKRTELYEAYLDMFLTREAEKTLTVRNNRNLLLELHGVIAWLLHSRAEGTEGGRGSGGDIARAELETVLRRYLEYEQRSPDLIDELFSGVQRVFVLVERGEGHFEFEVQPLREYFAARHLYTTSPQVPSTTEMTGARPDRLEALIRSPYWMNVTRFFCGHYQKGELADLSRRLIDLQDDPHFRYLCHPVELAQHIARDYSLAASQRDTTSVVERFSSSIGLRVLANGGSRDYQTSAGPSSFSDDTGRRAVVAAARTALVDPPSRELVGELSRLLRDNDAERSRWWSHEFEAHADNPEDRSYWLRIGVTTQSLRSIDVDELRRIFNTSAGLSRIDWLRVVESARHEVAEFDNDHFELVLDAMGSSPLLHGIPVHGAGNWLTDLATLLSDTWIWTRRRGDWYPPGAWLVKSNEREISTGGEVAPRIEQIQELIEVLAGPKSGPMRANASWWRAATDRTAATLDECWAAWRLALVGAMHPRNVSKWDGSVFDSAVSLLDRAGCLYCSGGTSSEVWTEGSHPAFREPHADGARMAFSAALLHGRAPKMF